MVRLQWVGVINCHATESPQGVILFGDLGGVGLCTNNLS